MYVSAIPQKFVKEFTNIAAYIIIFPSSQPRNAFPVRGHSESRSPHLKLPQTSPTFSVLFHWIRALLLFPLSLSIHRIGIDIFVFLRFLSVSLPYSYAYVYPSAVLHYSTTTGARCLSLCFGRRFIHKTSSRLYLCTMCGWVDWTVSVSAESHLCVRPALDFFR